MRKARWPSGTSRLDGTDGGSTSWACAAAPARTAPATSAATRTACCERRTSVIERVIVSPWFGVCGRTAAELPGHDRFEVLGRHDQRPGLMDALAVQQGDERKVQLAPAGVAQGGERPVHRAERVAEERHAVLGRTESERGGARGEA